MENKVGLVVGISISEKKGVEKKPISKGEFKKEVGLVGDAHSGNWHRMVSLLAQESIDKMIELGVKDLSSGKFAENITTKGLCLHKIPVGTKFKIGDVLFEVTQIGKECHKHCAIYHKVGDCIMPKEGIFARVLSNGFIEPNDKIEIL